MTNYKHTINQDIIIEQIIRYKIEIEKIKKTIKQVDTISEFNLAITPTGPHYFTGILQANNYSSYQNKSTHKKIALIFLQDTNKDKILLLKGNIGPTLGYTRKESKLIGLLKQKYNFIKTISPTKTINQIMLDQLYFIRILSDTKEILPIFVGTQINEKNIMQIIEKIFFTHTIFFIVNLNNSFPEKECKDKDQKLINQIINTKLTKTNKQNFQLISIFTEICKKFNKTPKSIAYINSGNITENSNKTTGYTNIIA